MSIYDNETKIYSDLNPPAPQKPQSYRLKKLTEIEVFFLDEIEERRREAKKKETTKYNHRYHRNRLNYLSSDRWRSLYPGICQRCRPARWLCLGRAWGSSFPFNGHYTKIFQGPNSEARKTRCHYGACPKQVRQHSRHHFTGNVRRR